LLASSVRRRRHRERDPLRRNWRRACAGRTQVMSTASEYRGFYPNVTTSADEPCHYLSNWTRSSRGNSMGLPAQCYAQLARAELASPFMWSECAKCVIALRLRCNIATHNCRSKRRRPVGRAARALRGYADITVASLELNSFAAGSVRSTTANVPFGPWCGTESAAPITRGQVRTVWHSCLQRLLSSLPAVRSR
jgi:hypothetical protein